MPSKSQRSPVEEGLLASATSLISPSKSCTIIPITLRWSGTFVSCNALIDSGAEGNFLDESWALKQGIPLQRREEATPLFALDGSSLPRVHLQSSPLSLTVSGNHHETLSFLVFHSPYSPVVLGHPWLVKHNPYINWSNNSILSWNLSCHVECLMSANPPVSLVSVSQEEPGD